VGYDGTPDERVEPEPAVLSGSYAIYAANSTIPRWRADHKDTLDRSDYGRSTCEIGLCSLDEELPTVRSYRLHEQEEEEWSSHLWPWGGWGSCHAGALEYLLPSFPTAVSRYPGLASLIA